MQHTIKAPTTVRELGSLSERLDMKLPEVWDLLTDALGDKWWEHGFGEVTFTVAEAPKPAAPPAGYVLAKGCADLWTGPETVKRGWIITLAWNSTTGLHTIELWTADHRPPTYSSLAPDDAVQLAADLIAAAQAARTAGA